MRMGKRINRILRADQIWARFTGDMKLLDFPAKGFYDYLIRMSKRKIYFDYAYNGYEKATLFDPTLVSRKYFGTIILRPSSIFNFPYQMFMLQDQESPKNMLQDIRIYKEDLIYVDSCTRIINIFNISIITIVAVDLFCYGLYMYGKK